MAQGVYSSGMEGHSLAKLPRSCRLGARTMSSLQFRIKISGSYFWHNLPALYACMAADQIGSRMHMLVSCMHTSSACLCGSSGVIVEEHLESTSHHLVKPEVVQNCDSTPHRSNYSGCNLSHGIFNRWGIPPILVCSRQECLQQLCRGENACWHGNTWTERTQL